MASRAAAVKFGRRPVAAAAMLWCVALFLSATPAMTHAAEPVVDYKARAAEVMRQLQKDYYLPDKGLYAESMRKRHAAFMWGNGVAFSALVAAAEHEPKTYRPIMDRFFRAMDAYWDAKAPHGGYEPAPTQGNGNDKYYDDNAWMVLGFTEAYDLTKNPAYLKRARESLKFVLSGEDDTLGGGIWWHEGHKDDSKNTCVTAPAAVGCLRVSDYPPAGESKAALAAAERLAKWTTEKLRLPNGLYADKITRGSEAVEKTTWTYNTGLMIRAYSGLYRRTKNPAYLKEAKRTAEAAKQLIDPQHDAYRDGFKFTHLLVEADLELYAITKDPELLKRARANADYAYATWQTKRPREMIEVASIARMLWLVADAASSK